eukprot:TRINITY_DN19907_c0_g2_i2.p1 TRINITY_DN19907_c0_g2~~TRINITY_DN19907_c0_g2_i2.p1  ORF type:complete len:344 (+),score=50.77 TRINITY_DN19907_c0_g2_i2:220-1251(+)
MGRGDNQVQALQPGLPIPDDDIATLLPPPPMRAAFPTTVCGLMCHMSSSVLWDARWMVCFHCGWATLLAAAHIVGGWNDLDEFGTNAFREVGVALSLLLVHRVTLAYNHFWEARGYVSGLQIGCRQLVRSVCMATSGGPEHQELLALLRESISRRALLVFTAQRLLLEQAGKQETVEVLAPFLELELGKQSPQVVEPQAVLAWISEDVRTLLCLELLPHMLAGPSFQAIGMIDESLSRTSKMLAEFPIPYHHMLHLALLIFGLLLPLPFVTEYRWFVAMPTACSALFLYSLEYLSRRLYRAYGRDSVQEGVPLFCMAAMGAALETDCRRIRGTVGKSSTLPVG